MARKPWLVTFEGTEGAGKSTLIKEVEALLKQEGYTTYVTREPGGSPVAEKIRSLILSEAMDPWTELFLYEAARAEHLAETVWPNLAKGRVVLCDRFTDSSLAYQGAARGLNWDKVKRLNTLATEGLKPIVTVLLDIDPEEGLKRAREHTRFEAEGVEFQTRVRSGYLKARREDPKRWLVLKVKDKTPQQLAAAVVKVLKKKLK